MTTDSSEQRTNRRRFLRQVGTALGVGVGALAVPSLAYAPLYQCCPDTDCGYTCTGEHGYIWPQRCECEGYSYCLCFTNNYCHSAPC